ncbi:hypothetical protein [Photorhabdus laumondii]|uniref:hypothetical protein n=1 Tax=Photorhabdus laumondii TaxID=2218628 RepID=UPI003D9C945A
MAIRFCCPFTCQSAPILEFRPIPLRLRKNRMLGVALAQCLIYRGGYASVVPELFSARPAMKLTTLFVRFSDEA